MVNEFNEFVRDCFSESGDIVIKPMMGLGETRDTRK